MGAVGKGGRILALFWTGKLAGQNHDKERVLYCVERACNSIASPALTWVS